MMHTCPQSDPGPEDITEEWECKACHESDLIREVRSLVLSLNAGIDELPEWARLRVQVLVKKLNG